MKIIEYMLKPILDSEFNRGYSAGVSAEKLVKAKIDTEREHDILERGKILGRIELLEEMENDIEEISAEEFDRLANMKPDKPFGFVGTIDDLTLVLEGDV